jgi:outer membrane protein
MKKLLVLLCVVSCVFLTAAAATADSINGRVGLSGRIGFLVPAESEAWDSDIETDAGFVGGGGLLIGLPNNFALELDVTYAGIEGDDWWGDDYDFNTTNISFGLQYRFANLPAQRLVPYVGAGVDILINDGEDDGGYGYKYDIDTVVGGHISGGVDYFLARNFALTAEVKFVFAPDADIKYQGNHVGDFDPTSIATTFGIRVFFN